MGSWRVGCSAAARLPPHAAGVNNRKDARRFAAQQRSKQSAWDDQQQAAGTAGLRPCLLVHLPCLPIAWHLLPCPGLLARAAGKRPGWHDGTGEVALHPSSICHPLETQQFQRPYLTYLEKVRRAAQPAGKHAALEKGRPCGEQTYGPACTLQ